MQIQYITDHASRPYGGNVLIVQICGQVGEVSTSILKLGTVKVVQVATEVWVANMIALHEDPDATIPLLRYSALRNCLAILGVRARELQAAIYMPRIGCGIGGGRWSVIAPLIREELRDIAVFVYDFSF